MKPAREHRLIWFKNYSCEQGRLVPRDGGERQEDDRQAWEMGELSRWEFGVNLEACVPVIHDLGACDEASLPDPERCLEIYSPELLARAVGQSYRIKDMFGFAKQIQGDDFKAWIERYRELWLQGFHVIRAPLGE